MITVKNRSMIVPLEERSIGTINDDMSESRVFAIDRLQVNGIDVSNLTFQLDMEYEDKSQNVTNLVKNITDDRAYLTWGIRLEDVQKGGAILVQIRAYSEDGIVRWNTYTELFYTEYAINMKPSETQLSMLEQYNENFKKLTVDNESALNEYNNTTEAKMKELINTADAKHKELSGLGKGLDERIKNITDNATGMEEVVDARGIYPLLGYRLEENEMAIAGLQGQALENTRLVWIKSDATLIESGTPQKFGIDTTISTPFYGFPEGNIFKYPFSLRQFIVDPKTHEFIVQSNEVITSYQHNGTLPVVLGSEKIEEGQQVILIVELAVV